MIESAKDHLDPEQLFEEMESFGVSPALFVDDTTQAHMQSLWDRSTSDAQMSEPGQRLRAWLDMCQLTDTYRNNPEIEILAKRIAAAWKLAGWDNIWIKPHLLIDYDAYQVCSQALPDVLPQDWDDAIVEWEWAWSQAVLDGAAAEAALMELATSIARRRFAAAGLQS